MPPQPAIANLQWNIKYVAAQGVLSFTLGLYACICRFGLDVHRVLGHVLLSLLSNTGSLRNAQRVFDKLPRCEFTWTTLIHGYNRHGHAQLALSLFKNMQEDLQEPNGYTFVTLLKACAQLKDAKRGFQVHAEAARRGFQADPYVGSILVDLYSKLGLVGKAQEVFDVLTKRDVVTWTALIAGLADRGFGELALDYFELMKCNGVAPNVVTYACTLKACGCIGNGEKGRELHNDVVQEGLLKGNRLIGNALIDMYCKCGMLGRAKSVFDELPDRDVVAWSSLIAGYADNDQNEEALKCFEKMKQKGVSPNAFTFSCSLKACGSVGALNKGSQIHEEILKGEWQQYNQFVGNALVDMYAKCGMLRKARAIFDKIPTHDRASWNALVTGYALLGEYDNVMDILERMREHCVKPDAVTFVSVLNACSHSGLVERGEVFYGVMCEAYRIAPALEHVTCIVDLLGRAGQLDKAVAAMRQSIFHPNLILWLTVLGACCKSENLDLGKEAFEQSLLLDGTQQSAYISMYNIYTRAGMIADAHKVEAMRAKAMIQRQNADGVLDSLFAAEGF